MLRQAKDIKEQLTPIVATLREGRAVIRPVSQVTLRLKAVEGKDLFATTIDDILRWINRRAGRSLPDVAWQRKSFELSDIGAQRTAAVSLKDPRYWAARLDDADKTVPLRTWVTEIGVGVDPNGDVLFGARLICSTRGADEPFDRSVPSFVKKIIRSGAATLDGNLVQRAPRVLSTAEDVAELVRLLEQTDRQGDVLVFSLPEGSENTSETAASAFNVHGPLQGVAHTFVLSGPASFYLTDAVGRDLSVFHQAVRIYRPGFRAWTEQPSNHPLVFPARVAEWGGEGPHAFERWLVNQALTSSVHGPHREDRLPAFNTVRQFAAQAERASIRDAGGSDADLVKLFEQDNEQLRTELKEQREQYDGLLAAADAEREAAAQAASAAKAQALERLHRIRALEQRLAKQDVGSPEAALPTNLDGFEDWCRENLAGAVELVSRAFQGVRKSEYHEPQFLYRVLLLLRDSYVPMRTEGTTERREIYQNALRDLQLEDSATGDGVKYASDLYSVQYGGVRRTLERHLKGSNSRDRRYGFRLYFFWDEEDQVVVVGWLPSHLDNRAS